MLSFELSGEPIDVPLWRERLLDPGCGGYASFEGWVRDLNEGAEVTALEYEAFAPLAAKEAERILGEATVALRCRSCGVHPPGGKARGGRACRLGGRERRHRDEAFRACRYIIDEVKHPPPDLEEGALRERRHRLGEL